MQQHCGLMGEIVQYLSTSLELQDLCDDSKCWNLLELLLASHSSVVNVTAIGRILYVAELHYEQVQVAN